nr:IclR family transcriptional regulator C-terminal domain-containing protein [Nocardia brasiliensis]
MDPDVLGFPAPVHGADGDVVAAVSIAALSTRVPDARVPDLAVAVLAAAAEITANLNG